jgi:hypothetical protein
MMCRLLTIAAALSLLAGLNWGAGPAVAKLPTTNPSATTGPTTGPTTVPTTDATSNHELHHLEADLKRAKRELVNVEGRRQKKLELDKGYTRAKAELETAALEKERAKSGTRPDRINASEAWKRARMNLERVKKEFMDSPDPDVEAQKAVVADIQTKIDAIHSEIDRAPKEQTGGER